jgi:hypothetical protein
MIKTAQVDGQTVKVGDFVSFKSDVEQGGKITAMKNASWGGKELTLESSSEYGFNGDYIGGEATTTVLASDCWID